MRQYDIFQSTVGLNDVDAILYDEAVGFVEASPTESEEVTLKPSCRGLNSMFGRTELNFVGN